jgi:hypothetical protein|tara:strand:- start:4252 stop:4674 length:423 start_codon:yes stop_codon:yes gene_type:complete
MSYLKLKEIKEFTVNNFEKKYWSFYDETKTGADAFLKSDDYVEGYSPKYTFNVNTGDMLDVSQAQLGQMLVGVFEAKKTLNGAKFLVKTNNKEGKEIRYYINYNWKGSSSVDITANNAVIADKQATEGDNSEVSPDVIPF